MNNLSSQRRLDVLLVEDNEADVRLCREVFSEGRYPLNIHVARDGEEALDFLFRRGRFKGAPRPHLVLLDLNLPRKDGREVLAEMKSDTELRRTPVVILTTSRAAADITRSYDLHANCYIVKPVDLGQFIEVIRAVEDYWFSIARLPIES